MRRHLIGHTYSLRDDNSRAKRWRDELALDRGELLVTVVSQTPTHVKLLVLSDQTRFGFETTVLDIDTMRESDLWRIIA